jgi:hypothetical protein
MKPTRSCKYSQLHSGGDDGPQVSDFTVSELASAPLDGR